MGPLSELIAWAVVGALLLVSYAVFWLLGEAHRGSAILVSALGALLVLRALGAVAGDLGLTRRLVPRYQGLLARLRGSTPRRRHGPLSEDWVAAIVWGIIIAALALTYVILYAFGREDIGFLVIVAAVLLWLVLAAISGAVVYIADRGWKAAAGNVLSVVTFVLFVYGWVRLCDWLGRCGISRVWQNVLGIAIPVAVIALCVAVCYLWDLLRRLRRLLAEHEAESGRSRDL